ncbi:MAG TPA: hypothetical protein VGV57_01210 [Thermoleophilaceae bacterium]|nr:hypothetical protein [Thermoleophilaceae bacterium]
MPATHGRSRIRRTFPHFGVNVHVLQPGEPASKYHAEEAQEASSSSKESACS